MQPAVRCKLSADCTRQPCERTPYLSWPLACTHSHTHTTATAVQTVKRVSLELGGNAPFIVFDDADLELAATGVVASALRNSGQTCICANRVFVADKVCVRACVCVGGGVFWGGGGASERGCMCPGHAAAVCSLSTHPRSLLAACTPHVAPNHRSMTSLLRLWRPRWRRSRWATARRQTRRTGRSSRRPVWTRRGPRQQQHHSVVDSSMQLSTHSHAVA